MKDFEILPTTSFLHVCGGDPQNQIMQRLVVWSFLHVCGGDPVGEVEGGIEVEFSPRMWR